MKLEINGQRFVVEYDEHENISVFYIDSDLDSRLIVSETVVKKFGPLNYISKDKFPEGLVEKLEELFLMFDKNL